MRPAMPTSPQPRSRETFVFAFETREQRDEVFEKLKPYIMAEAGVRVIGMSSDDEMKRGRLMEEAADRYKDLSELRDAIDAIGQCPDLSEWSWEKFDNEG
jgi:hypothetical protein